MDLLYWLSSAVTIGVFGALYVYARAVDKGRVKGAAARRSVAPVDATVVSASDAKLIFPVLVLRVARPGRDRERSECFFEYESAEALQTARRELLRRDELPGMLLVDNEGRSFVVRGTRRRASRTSPWMQLLLTIFGRSGDIREEVELDLEPEAAIDFEEVQRRVIESIDRNRDDWLDDEAVAGESGPQVDPDELLEAARAAVRRASNVAELFDNLEAALSD